MGVSTHIAVVIPIALNARSPEPALGMREVHFRSYQFPREPSSDVFEHEVNFRALLRKNPRLTLFSKGGGWNGNGLSAIHLRGT
jgi:hypothetical protein